jgi:hypothetical protein
MILYKILVVMMMIIMVLLLLMMMMEVIISSSMKIVLPLINYEVLGITTIQRHLIIQSSHTQPHILHLQDNMVSYRHRSLCERSPII